ncbi:MAG: antitoxin MazE family protein [Geminicoccaceae bacterium]
MTVTIRSSTQDRVRSYRERMRAKGFRQIQLWVPDTRSPDFAAECRRQSLLVTAEPAEREVMDELEALQDTEGWRP